MCVYFYFKSNSRHCDPKDLFQHYHTQSPPNYISFQNFANSSASHRKSIRTVIQFLPIAMTFPSVHRGYQGVSSSSYPKRTHFSILVFTSPKSYLDRTCKQSEEWLCETILCPFLCNLIGPFLVIYARKTRHPRQDSPVRNIQLAQSVLTVSDKPTSDDVLIQRPNHNQANRQDDYLVTRSHEGNFLTRINQWTVEIKAASQKKY